MMKSYKELVQQFRERIIGILAEQGVTQNELARRLVITQVAVHNYTSGKSLPKHKMLLQISEKLGCTPEWLLFGVGEKYDSKGK